MVVMYKLAFQAIAYVIIVAVVVAPFN